MRTTRHSAFTMVLVVLVTTLVFAGCSSDDSDTTTADTTAATTGTSTVTTTTTTTTTTPPTSVTDTDPDTIAFCDEAGALSTELPESYVGSPEHLADLERIRDVAPDELRDDLDAIVDYFEAEVDPADPESQLTENFPDEIVAAIHRAIAFIDQHCGA